MANAVQTLHVATDSRLDAERLSKQAFYILQAAFVLAPIIAGVDKFTDRLVDWDKYLAPMIGGLVGGRTHLFMQAAGIVEIAAGLGIAFMPRIFAYVVALWLWGIIVNLLFVPGFFDIALRDFGLSLAALALGRLSQAQMSSQIR